MKIIFYIYLIIISIIAFIPNNGGVDIGAGDKTNHILAFVVFGILYRFSFQNRYVFIWGLFFGIYIELIQHFLPYRDSSILDIIADSIGLIFSISIFWFCRNIFKREEK